MLARFFQESSFRGRRVWWPPGGNWRMFSYVNYYALPTVFEGTMWDFWSLEGSCLKVRVTV